MINLKEKIELRDGDNYLYYQDLGRHAIGDYRANYETTDPDPPSSPGESVYLNSETIDFVDDAVVGSQALLLKPKYYAGIHEEGEDFTVYTIGYLKVNFKSQSKGDFYGGQGDPTQQIYNRLTFRYKFIKGFNNAYIKISIYVSPSEHGIGIVKTIFITKAIR